jgi:hypothetical protein
MSRPDSQNIIAPPDPPHPGYQQPYPFKYPIFQLNLFGVLGLLVMVPVVSGLTTQLQGGEFPILLTTLYHALGVFLVGILTILAHEHIHGYVMGRFGYKARFGFNWKLFAAYAIAEEQFMTREHTLWVTIAPVFVITTIAVPLLAVPFAPLVTIAYFALLFNTLGAFGDFYALFRLLRMPAGTLLYDISPFEMFVYEPR